MNQNDPFQYQEDLSAEKSFGQPSIYLKNTTHPILSQIWFDQQTKVRRKKERKREREREKEKERKKEKEKEKYYLKNTF